MLLSVIGRDCQDDITRRLLRQLCLQCQEQRFHIWLSRCRRSCYPMSHFATA